MTNRHFFGILIIFFGLLIVVSCTSYKKLHADWIISDMKYKSNDVSEFLSLANLTINFNSNMGVVPPVLLDEFYDEHNAFQTHFEYKKENGKEYLDIKGSKFFTDTWEIKRLDNDCCKISLSTEDKYF